MNQPVQKLLTPFGWLFASVVSARRKLYDNQILNSQDLGVPVVSVGNLTVGGTGKTPLVVSVAKVLAENGHRVCILTRGYKRAKPHQRVLVSDGQQILADAQQSGDEPFELAYKLIGKAAVIADKRRAEAGKWARENWGVTAFVLDDGFQHWQIKRGLDIVAVDATNPFGNGKLLPAGTLREDLTALQRADCVVLTRANLAQNISNLKSQIVKINANCPILLSETKIVAVKPLAEFHAATQSEQKPRRTKDEGQRTTPAFAFCGLGNPESFFENLRRGGFQICGEAIFSDHHIYTQKDAAAIEKAAQTENAKILLTTAKDAVKLKNLQFTLPCFVIEIAVAFDDEKPLREMLAAL